LARHFIVTAKKGKGVVKRETKRKRGVEEPLLVSRFAEGGKTLILFSGKKEEKRSAERNLEKGGGEPHRFFLELSEIPSRGAQRGKKGLSGKKIGKESRKEASIS